MGKLFGSKSVKLPSVNRNWPRYNTIKAGLVAEVYAYAKKDWRESRGIPNIVKPQRKIEKVDTTMLKIAEPFTKNSACLEIPQYQNSRPQLRKYRMKICQTQ